MSASTLDIRRRLTIFMIVSYMVVWLEISHGSADRPASRVRERKGDAMDVAKFYRQCGLRAERGMVDAIVLIDPFGLCHFSRASPHPSPSSVSQRWGRSLVRTFTS